MLGAKSLRGITIGLCALAAGWVAIAAFCSPAVAASVAAAAARLAVPPALAATPPIRSAAAEPDGALGLGDVADAASLIQKMAEHFGRLGRLETAQPAKTRWLVLARTYDSAAGLLRTLIVGGQMGFVDLPPGSPARLAGGGIILDTTLDGLWSPDAVARDRRQARIDSTPVSRLAAVLVERLAVHDPSGAWRQWLRVHERNSASDDLAGALREGSLLPELVRFWHLQDQYLADLGGAFDGPGNGSAGLGGALDNEVLGVLKRVEQTGRQSLRQALEAEWHRFKTAAARLAVPSAEPKTTDEAAPAGAQIAAAPRERQAPSAEAPGAAPAAAAEVSQAGSEQPGLETLDRRLDALTARLQEQSRRLDEVVERLAGEATAPAVEELRAALAAERERGQALAAQLEELTGALESLRQEGQAEPGAVEELRAALAAERERGQALAARLDELSGAVENARQEAQASPQAVDQVRAALAVEQRRGQALETRVQDLTGALEGLRQQAGAEPQGVEELRKALAAEQQRGQALAARVQDLTGALEGLRQQVGAEPQRIEELRKALAAEQQRGQALEGRLQDLTGALGALRGEMTAGQERVGEAVASLRQDVQNEPQAIKDLRTALDAERGRAQALEVRVGTLSQELDAARQQGARIQSELSALRAQTVESGGPWAQPRLWSLAPAALALFALALAGLALWAPRASRRQQGAPQGVRSDLVRLRGELAAERGHAEQLQQRLTELDRELEEAREQAGRLQRDLDTVRQGTVVIGKDILQGAAERDALEQALRRLRAEVELGGGEPTGYGPDEAPTDAASETASARSAASAEAAAPAGADLAEPRSLDAAAGSGQAAAMVGEPAAAPPPLAAEPAIAAREQAIDALHRGDLAAFEAAFARLAGLSPARIETLLKAADGRELAIACRAVDIGKPHLAAILVLSRREFTGAGALSGRGFSDALTYYDRTSVAAARETLARWREPASAAGTADADIDAAAAGRRDWPAQGDRAE